MLPQAARRRDTSSQRVPSPGPAGNGEIPAKPPPAASSCCTQPLHGAQPQPHSPVFGSRSPEGAGAGNSPSLCTGAPDPPQEEQRGPRARARPGPAHLARGVCFILYYYYYHPQSGEAKETKQGAGSAGPSMGEDKQAAESASRRGERIPGRDAPRCVRAQGHLLWGRGRS